jgi:hypothetical protein
MNEAGIPHIVPAAQPLGSRQGDEEEEP